MLELADIYIIFTYVVVAVTRRLGLIGQSDPMESFVGSFTPQRVEKRIVQAL